MSGSTRRAFVKNSAAAAAGVTVVGALLTEEAQARVAVQGGPIVAYVHDARTGEVSVLAGDREVHVRDRKLAAQIANAAR
jgi:hypothetical protein